MTTRPASRRIDVADVIRGFALLGILLIHCIEHYNLFGAPLCEKGWLLFSDTVLWNSVFFLFAGKAYGLFALLFGFSFFIQDHNRLQRGQDFRLRFLWRLALLFVWGEVNSIFYNGDILVLFSLVGVALILTARMGDRTVLWIAALCLL